MDEKERPIWQKWQFWFFAFIVVTFVGWMDARRVESVKEEKQEMLMEEVLSLDEGLRREIYKGFHIAWEKAEVEAKEKHPDDPITVLYKLIESQDEYVADVMERHNISKEAVLAIIEEGKDKEWSKN